MLDRKRRDATDTADRYGLALPVPRRKLPNLKIDFRDFISKQSVFVNKIMRHECGMCVTFPLSVLYFFVGSVFIFEKCSMLKSSFSASTIKFGGIGLSVPVPHPHQLISSSPKEPSRIS